MNAKALVVVTALWCLTRGVCCTPGLAQESAADSAADLAAELDAAKKHAVEQTYVMRYKFTKGEQVQWRVKHLGTTEATIQGKTQSSKSRSISTKVWEVQDIDAEGNITFVHSVANIDMWQKVSNKDEVRYNSATDKTPPPEYAHAANSVGVPLATIEISPWGKVLKRTDAPAQTNLGLGEIVMPVPVDPVKIGQRWHVANEIRVRRQDHQVKRIKTRLVYELESVKTGVATIAVRTEVLTPINDPRIKSQLVQQLTDGHVRFDLDAGRILSREVDWDETVVGFNGDDSLMKYLARFTEDLVSTPTTAQSPGHDVR